MQTLETASPPTAPEPDAPPARRWRPSAPGRASVVATVLVWTPMLLWYAAFRPGLMSSDSITVYSYAVHGGWVDYHPPAYIAAMWLSASVLGSPSLLTLAQSLLLAAAIVAVARSLLRLGVHRFAVYGATAVVAILPTVGAFSISLWKDVPYAAAFLFLGARVIDLTRARLIADTDAARSAAWSICCWSCLAVVMRQNGILLVGGLAVVLWIISKAQRRQMVAVLVIPVALLLVLKVVVYPVMGVASSGAQPPLELQLHDIADAAARHPAMFTDADRAFLDTMAPFDVWATSYAGFGCWSAAWQWDSRFDWSKLDGHTAPPRVALVEGRA